MNIVAVDHEPTTLEDLTKKLRTVFPTSIIKGFNNPIEPLQYAQSNKIDMLFTDVRLRPFDGYELIKILGQTQSFYSYVVSGSKEHPDDLRWMKVTGTFSKPITTTELTQIRDG
ncbi:MAG: response regulator, partial [Oscillospiraceae bacterium]